MSETELNKVTFIIFIFEGIGEVIGGLLVVFFSNKIKSPPKVYIVIATLFLVAFGIVYLGSALQNYYIIGLGTVICGICDCSNLMIEIDVCYLTPLVF